MEKAVLVLRRRVVYSEREFAELVVWELPEPAPPSRHRVKYRLAFVVDGVRVLGFDNERGKGDHRHDRGAEAPYLFTDVETLVADFFAAIETRRSQDG